MPVIKEVITKTMRFEIFGNLAVIELNDGKTHIVPSARLKERDTYKGLWKGVEDYLDNSQKIYFFLTKKQVKIYKEKSCIELIDPETTSSFEQIVKVFKKGDFDNVYYTNNSTQAGRCLQLILFNRAGRPVPFNCKIDLGNTPLPLIENFWALTSKRWSEINKQLKKCPRARAVSVFRRKILRFDYCLTDERWNKLYERALLHPKKSKSKWHSYLSEIVLGDLLKGEKI